MSQYTHTTLSRHLVRALYGSSAAVGAVSIGVWLALGRDAGIAVWVGAAIIALPQIWLAISMFSGLGSQMPTLLGIAKFSLSALLFGVWFSRAQDPQPGPVFLGAIVVLVCSPVFYYLAAKKIE